MNHFKWHHSNKYGAIDPKMVPFTVRYKFIKFSGRKIEMDRTEKWCDIKTMSSWSWINLRYYILLGGLSIGSRWYLLSWIWYRRRYMWNRDSVWSQYSNMYCDKPRWEIIIFCEKISINLGMENGADSSIIEYGEYTDWIY